jgi:hypothetical protein
VESRGALRTATSSRLLGDGAVSRQDRRRALVQRPRRGSLERDERGAQLATLGAGNRDALRADFELQLVVEHRLRRIGLALDARRDFRRRRGRLDADWVGARRRGALGAARPPELTVRDRAHDDRDGGSRERSQQDGAHRDTGAVGSLHRLQACRRGRSL